MATIGSMEARLAKLERRALAVSEIVRLKDDELEALIAACSALEAPVSWLDFSAALASHSVTMSEPRLRRIVAEASNARA